MPKRGQTIHRVRRRDREITEDHWIREYLHVAPFGFLATTVDEQPFINSNLFVYDEEQEVIYMHTARFGRTRSNIEAGGLVCFSTAEMGRLLPADEALEFSVEYSGVAVFGRGAVVEDDHEAKRALQLLLDKYFPHLKPGQDYRPITPEEIERTSVYRISIEEWSGKRKAVGEDFPGAFHYPDHPSAGE